MLYKRMPLKKIFVHRAVVEHNHEAGTSNPVFTVWDGEQEHHSNSIILLGPCEIKYDPTGTQGNRIWIETYDKVILKYALDSQPDRPDLVAV